MRDCPAFSAAIVVALWLSGAGVRKGLFENAANDGTMSPFVMPVLSHRLS